MHILMISPQPFFQFRGTPFSVRERLKALSALGHRVDLVTYHIGQQVEIPGVRVHRSFPILFLRHVPIGPSWVKFPLDMVLAMRALLLLPALRHVDIVQSHEEGAVIGLILAKLLRKPHIYDMHSSLPQQLVNYNFTHSRILLAWARRTERWILRKSAAIIVVCPWLKDLVREINSTTPVFLIENPPVCDPPGPEVPQRSTALRAELGLRDKKIILYTGTLEVNQGLDIVLEAIPRVVAQEPDALFLFVGGEPEQVKALQDLARDRGVDHWIRLTGQQPSDAMPGYMHMASILISPRKVGQNTPLKIYSYLQSGRPIVATRLETHTQVLDDKISVLVEPKPDAFANGILRILGDQDFAHRIATEARRRLGERYSWDRYLEHMSQFCDFLAKLPPRSV